MNPTDQSVFDNIIGKLNQKESITKNEILILRARRSYLSNLQRLKYGDILYFNKQFIFQKSIKSIIWTIKIISPIIFGLIVFFITKRLK